MTDVTAVVFDIGGVLLDWSPRYLYDELIPDAAERERFLTEIATPAWNHQQDAGRSWADAVAELSARHPEQAGWVSAYDTGWARMARGTIADTEILVGELRAAGVPTYALTNFSAEKWPVALEMFEVLRGFDGAVVSGVEQTTKPDEKLYRILLERYDLDPARTFYTDDVPANVRTARAVGMHAEQFTTPAALRTHLHDRGLPV